MARYDLSGKPLPSPDDGRSSANPDPIYRAPQPPVDLTAPGDAAARAPSASFSSPSANLSSGEEASGQAPRAKRSYPIDALPPAAAAYGDLYGGNDSGRDAGVPREVAELRWNWGAFFLPPMWCAANGVPALGYVYDLIGILFLLSPVLYGPVYGVVAFFITLFVLFGIGIYVGARGNELAWKNRVFDNGVHGFFEVQQRWMISGFAIALPLYLVLIGAFGFQTIRAGQQQQALVNRAINPPTVAPPTAYTPPQNGGGAQILQRQAPPSQTIIYGRPSGIYGAPNYAPPNARMSISPYPGANGRGPNAALPRAVPTGPTPGNPAITPGAAPAGAPPLDPNSTPNGGQNYPGPAPAQPQAPQDQTPPTVYAPDTPPAPADAPTPNPDQNGAPPAPQQYPGASPGQ